MVGTQPGMYCNPFWDRNFPDPFVLKTRGRYYAYATEHEIYPSDGTWVFSILESKDLITWHEVGKAMPALGLPYCRYWAPEVTEYNGRFLLYYAVHTSEFAGGIRVALADHPTGPFLDSGHDLTGHLLSWAIDPHVFRDQDGQWYLYMTIEYLNDPESFIGSGNAVDKLITPFTLQGTITRVTPPRKSWQLFEAQRKERGGVDWYTVEGPTVLQHRGQYYEMFSGGCYYRDNYAVSYATAERPMGTGGMHDTAWQEWEGGERKGLLIQGDGKNTISPGHNSLVLGPNNVDWYIVYHAWQQDMVERRPYLDRLFWHGETMWTAAPTSTLQPAPALPRFRECFEEALLQPSWQQGNGYWHVAHEEVIQEDTAAPYATLRQHVQPGKDWLLEVHLCHRAGNGSYGVLLAAGGNAALTITITPDLHLALWSSTAPEEPFHMIPLPDGTLVSAWHQLLISSSGSILSVRFDGLHMLTAVVAQQTQTFSLLTESTSAAFSAISLTDHYNDEFLDDQHSLTLLGWETGSANDDTSLPTNWRVQNGTLEQTSNMHDTHLLLKGAQLENYEFGVTMHLCQRDKSEQGAFGLVAWHNAGMALLLCFAHERDSWILKAESSGIFPAIDRAYDLPHTFDASLWHTFRVVRQREEVTLYLDGLEMFTVSIPSQPGRSGLVTRNVAAAFKHVWQTGLSL